MDEAARRVNSLAYCFQESFTAILRVRSQRQVVENSDAFRTQIRAALRAAVDQGRALGYPSDLVQMALFAAVAYLDESVLNLQNPAFADWSRRPLQEELFGGHTAGEQFFRNLQDLLGRQDSTELADCLEVYALCLLLGFKGRYALGGTGDLQVFVRQIREKLGRIRGNIPMLPATTAAEGKAPARRDRVSWGLGVAAASLFVLMAIAFAGFEISLGSGVSAVQNSSLSAP